MSADISYVSGSGRAIVRQDAIVLFGAGSDPGTSTIRALRAAESFGAMVDALGGTSRRFETIPPFVALSLEADGVVILVRGDRLTAVVTTNAGPVTFDGAGLLTWAEHHLDRSAVSSIVLSNSADPCSVIEPLPIEVGVVAASRVITNLRAGPTADTSITEKAAGTKDPEPPVITADCSNLPPSDANTEERAAEQDDSATHDASSETPAASPTIGTGPPPSVQESVTEPERAESGGYDFLFQGTEQLRHHQALATRGNRVAPDPSSAARNESIPVAGDSPPKASAEEQTSTWSEPTSKPPPEPIARDSGDPMLPVSVPTTGDSRVASTAAIDVTPSLINSVPSGVLVDAPSSAARAPVEIRKSVQHHDFADERTTLRTQNIAASGTSATMVPAVHCERGHLSPPHAETCRRCGAPLLEEDPVTVPRPVLGHLRFSSGQVVQLDRPAIIGRLPKAEGVSAGDLPNLVMVNEDDPEVSRSHVAVRLEGWHVLVVDLRSTNGTVVTLPFEAPVRLHGGEEKALIPGSRVELSPAVHFVFEVDPE